ncbi:MAG: S-ribosylhomocysteine lyase [Erysipelotrichaceae bacterium]|nr:S-ribosylhomocysteine lyase [Erysipelotrichaceae bacterium]
MQKIKSFTINHNILQPGVYMSRLDYFQSVPIITLDIRLKRPNIENPLEMSEIHTMEHLGATFLRNHLSLASDVVYFGPMGCRTGFYLLIHGNHSTESLLKLVEDTMEFIAAFEGEIPGSTAIECGNYLDHDLKSANLSANDFLSKLRVIQTRDLQYPG